MPPGARKRRLMASLTPRAIAADPAMIDTRPGHVRAGRWNHREAVARTVRADRAAFAGAGDGVRRWRPAASPSGRCGRSRSRAVRRRRGDGVHLQPALPPVGVMRSSPSNTSIAARAPALTPTPLSKSSTSACPRAITARR